MPSQAGAFRSWMFVPGDRQRMIEKALALPRLDAAMLDLEDAVAVAQKEAARQLVADSIERIAHPAPEARHATVKTPACYVRVNAVAAAGTGGEGDWLQADLAAVVRRGLDGLVLPKIESPEQVKLVADLVDRLEPEVGLTRGSVRLLVAIETPRGLLNALALATASPRVVGLILGAEDFSRELGLPLRRQAEALDLLYVRSALVVAAAAANVQPVDAVWMDYQDADGLMRYAQQSRRLGFTGMSVIHPSQIDIVNAAFAPTPEEVDYCRRVVEAFEEAERRGSGVTAVDGHLIDAPVVERARRTLAAAESREV